MSARSKRKKSAADQARAFVWRLGICLFVFAVVVQYVRIIGRNVVVSHEVVSDEAEIRSLQMTRDEELIRIKRLERADGAIPEIHDRLHLTKPGEAIVYLHHEGDGNASTSP